MTRRTTAHWLGIKPQPPSKVVGHYKETRIMPKSIKGQSRDIRRELIAGMGYTWGQIEDLPLNSDNSTVGYSLVELRNASLSGDESPATFRR